MASYLEEYGAAEEKNAKRMRAVKWTAGVLIVVSLVGFILFLIFQNYSEEQQVKAFIGLLKAQDYPRAYRMWGCTEDHPCRDYSMKRFLDDWGPGSAHANAAAAEIGSGDTCGTGVLVPVNFKGAEEVPLWVDTTTKIIGFSPDPECRKRKWHFKEFFQRLRS